MLMPPGSAGEGGQDAVQVESGEPPLERGGDRAVSPAESEERGGELVERGEVRGIEHLALDDAEVELD